MLVAGRGGGGGHALAAAASLRRCHVAVPSRCALTAPPTLPGLQGGLTYMAALLGHRSTSCWTRRAKIRCKLR